MGAGRGWFQAIERFLRLCEEMESGIAKSSKSDSFVLLSLTEYLGISPVQIRSVPGLFAYLSLENIEGSTSRRSFHSNQNLITLKALLPKFNWDDLTFRRNYLLYDLLSNARVSHYYFRISL